MRLILPGEKPISWNKIYEGRSWQYRKTIADYVHELVERELMVAGWKVQDARMFKNRVDIEIIAYFAGRLLDSDNIPAKFYIDGLKDRVIMDDSPKYVRSVTTTSERDIKNPRMEIWVNEYD